MCELTDSYYRCTRDDSFLDSFYDTFLSKSPAVADMFSMTEFRLQKLMLRQSLLEIICFHRGMSGTREEIERLGRRHRELGVTSEMYTMWLDALCETIEKYDPDYSAELEQAWREAVLKAVETMIGVDSPQESD